ncbi:MAG: SIS domain-containing protein [Erysipelotrichaceae bacterium]
MICTDNVSENILQDSQYLIKEIEQQPRIWKETYELIKRNKEELKTFLNDYEEVIFTGAGTSEFVGNTIFRALDMESPVEIKSIGTTDILSHPQYYFKKDVKTLLISCARSGNSPESVATVNLANQYIDEVKHLIITCNPNGALAKYTENKNAFLLLMPEGTNDKSYAMTSSFTSMALAGYLCFHLDTLDDQRKYVEWIINQGNYILNEKAESLKKVVDSRKFDRLVYLGGGCLKGLAQEAALKALELTAGKLSTMYDSPLGYRHGPSSFVKLEANSLIVMLFSCDEYSNKYDKDMFEEIVSYHGKNNYFLTITCGNEEFNLSDNYRIHMKGSNIPECYIAFPDIIVAQLIACYRSWTYGIGPDYPFGHKDNDIAVNTTIYPNINKHIHS